MGNSSSQTGMGPKLGSLDVNFTQGSMSSTGVATDVAITGRGFFVLGNPTTATEYYTRAGHFTLDNQGYYINSQGDRVRGYLFDSTGTNLIESVVDIQINQRSMVAPRETTDIDLALNLNAGAGTITAAFAADDPNTYNFSTSLVVYDSLGQSHSVQVFFTKTAPQQWDWHAMIDASDVLNPPTPDPQVYGEGAITFDALTGQFSSGTTTNFYGGAVTFANGLTPPASQIDFANSTQYGAPSGIQSILQNGYGAGSIMGVSIDAEGVIFGNYTNGTTRRIAQLVLADFTNLYGLKREGSMLYLATSESGDPWYNAPGVGGVGTVSSSMLEESNVDLAADFIKMMILQRGFQANSKVITTTDEMLAQLISIK
jgi:flagellar hook protein FlgE